MQIKLNSSQIVISLYLIILSSIITVTLNSVILLQINAIIYLILIFYFIFFKKTDLFFKIFLILLIVISLGTLTDSWDARSIWLLKTKILYYDSNIFNIYDHPKFSHPTYPSLAPIFASIFIKTLNYWNEILPKVGLLLLYFPVMIYLSTKFKDAFLYALLSFLLLIIGKYFFNGEMDGLVSIYFITTLLLSYETLFIFNNDNDHRLKILFLNNIVLSLLKFEGTVLVLIISITFFFYFIFTNRVSLKRLTLIFLSSIPSLLWLYHSNELNNLYAVGESNFSLSNLLLRIDDLSSYFLIAKYFFSDTKFLLSIILFLLIFYKSEIDKNFLKLTLLVNLMYFLILVLIYLSTNYDLNWHLSSSANRIIKPITLSLIIASLYNINLNKIKILFKK